MTYFVIPSSYWPAHHIYSERRTGSNRKKLGHNTYLHYDKFGDFYFVTYHGNCIIKSTRTGTSFHSTDYSSHSTIRRRWALGGGNVFKLKTHRISPHDIEMVNFNGRTKPLEEGVFFSYSGQGEEPTELVATKESQPYQLYNVLREYILKTWFTSKSALKKANTTHLGSLIVDTTVELAVGRGQKGNAYWIYTTDTNEKLLQMSQRRRDEINQILEDYGATIQGESSIAIIPFELHYDFKDLIQLYHDEKL